MDSFRVGIREFSIRLQELLPYLFSIEIRNSGIKLSQWKVGINSSNKFFKHICDTGVMVFHSQSREDILPIFTISKSERICYKFFRLESFIIFNMLILISSSFNFVSHLPKISFNLFYCFYCRLIDTHL